MTGKSKKKIILKMVSVVDIGCSNCKKPNFSSIFNPFPKKPRLPNNHHYHSSSSSAAATTATPPNNHMDSDTSSSSTFYHPHKTPATPMAAAVVVEKDFDDPYHDFRQSMVQMILENEIYSKDDLMELLLCFLRLNARYHHGIIVVLSPKSRTAFSQPQPCAAARRPSSAVMEYAPHVISNTTASF